MKKRSTGYAYGIAAAISYGMNPLFALPLYSGGIEVNSVLFYRYFFAVIIYGIWLKFIKKVSFKIKIEAILPLFFLGILFSFSSLFLFEAFKLIDAGIACTILFVYPVLVALIMGLFFKEKIDKTIVFSLLLTTIGIGFLCKYDNSANLNFKGVFLVLAASLCYALYMIGVQKIKAVKHIKSNLLSFYIMLFGLFVYIYNLKFCIELQVLNNHFLWICVLALAIIPTIVSIETITIAIKLIGSTKTALLGSFEPLTALFIGVLVFGETINARIISGVVLILIGVALIVIRNRNKKYT